MRVVEPPLGGWVDALYEEEVNVQVGHLFLSLISSANSIMVIDGERTLKTTFKFRLVGGIQIRKNTLSYSKPWRKQRETISPAS